MKIRDSIAALRAAYVALQEQGKLVRVGVHKLGLYDASPWWMCLACGTLYRQNSDVGRCTCVPGCAALS